MYERCEELRKGDLLSASVTDESAHREPKILNAAKVIGRSVARLEVFKAIYFGKKKIKSQDYIRERAVLKTNKRVLEEGKKLVTERIVDQVRLNGETAYKKIDFYHKNQKAIISLVKRNIAGKLKLISSPSGIIEVRINSQPIARAKRITVDDIDSFSKVKRVANGVQKRYYESDIKERLKRIMNEDGKFQDWGGETNDIYTDRLVYRGKRIATAFALKGKATQPPLTPRKMGKNGDQIGRLFRSPAQIFLIVYDEHIEESIGEQMETFAERKAAEKKKTIFYGIINGRDLTRLFAAYQN